MKKNKSTQLKDAIERPLFVSDLDYVITKGDIADDPEMCNYQVEIRPPEEELSSATDREQASATLPQGIVTKLQDEFPNITVQSVFGVPSVGAEHDVLYFTLNDGVEYEVSNFFDFTTDDEWEYTDRMEHVTKALRKPDLDTHLTGPWHYTATPPRPWFRSSNKRFRAVEQFPGEGRVDSDPEIFYPSNIIEFLRIPDPLEDSITGLNRGSTQNLGNTNAFWIGNTNYVTLTSGDIHTHSHDPETSSKPHPDTGYYVSGAFATPTTTTNIDDVVAEAYNAIERTNNAVQLNTEIEQLWTVLQSRCSDNWQDLSKDTLTSTVESIGLAELTTSLSIPIKTIHGVGKETIGRIAQEFGTYHALAQATPDDIGRTNNYYHIDKEKLISTAEVAAKAHGIWRRDHQTSIPKDDITELLNYPKDHPSISITSQEAGRPAPITI